MKSTWGQHLKLSAQTGLTFAMVCVLIGLVLYRPNLKELGALVVSGLLFGSVSSSFTFAVLVVREIRKRRRER